MYKNILLAVILCNSYISGNPLENNTPLHVQLQAGLALEPLLQEAAAWVTNDKVAIYLPDASERATEFVRFFAKELAIPNYEQLQVKVGDGYAATNSVVILDQLSDEDPYWSKLDYAFLLTENASTSEDIEYAQLYFDTQIGSLEHEFAHITKKHSRNCGIMLGLIAATSFITSQFLEHKFLAEFIKNSSLLKKVSYGITSGALLLLINRLAWHAIVRKQEQEADDAIRNNSNILYARTVKFYELHEELRNFIKNERGQKRLALFDKYPFLYQIFDFHHPTHLARAQRFEQRYKDSIAQNPLPQNG